MHAMGYDAYHLVGNLFNAGELGMDELSGATGKLFLTQDGRVHRKLAWAQFERGQPVPLPDPDAFQDITDDGGPREFSDEAMEWQETSPDD